MLHCYTETQYSSGGPRINMKIMIEEIHARGNSIDVIRLSNSHLGAYRTTTLYFGQQHADSGLEDPGGPPEELMESRRPLYHGVPVLGIPMIFDLFDNLLHLQERGAIKRLKNWLMLTLTALSRDYIGFSTETVADTTVTKMIWAIISDIIGYATYLTDLSIKIV
ncbi:unnamed protein product [Gadus morhua 'NCC']